MKFCSCLNYRPESVRVFAQLQCQCIIGKPEQSGAKLSDLRLKAATVLPLLVHVRDALNDGDTNEREHAGEHRYAPPGRCLSKHGLKSPTVGASSGGWGAVHEVRVQSSLLTSVNLVL